MGRLGERYLGAKVVNPATKLTREMANALNARAFKPRGRTASLKASGRVRSRPRPYDAGKALLTQIRAEGLPEPQLEYRFHPTRKWRIDFFWPDAAWAPYAGLAVELEGGAFVGGRHTRGKGYEDDIVKYNEIGLTRILLIRCTPGQVRDGSAVQWVRRALSAELM